MRSSVERGPASELGSSSSRALVVAEVSAVVEEQVAVAAWAEVAEPVSEWVTASALECCRFEN